jgi:hypothetical protein
MMTAKQMLRYNIPVNSTYKPIIAMQQISRYEERGFGEYIRAYVVAKAITNSLKDQGI